MKPISGLLHVVVYKCGSGFRSTCRHCFVIVQFLEAFQKVCEGHILLCSMCCSNVFVNVFVSFLIFSCFFFKFVIL